MTTEAPAAEVPRPSMFLFDPLDTEQTQLTKIAHLAAAYALEDAEERYGGQAHPVEFVTLASGETIVWEVHGQSSVTGHGKQGLRPARVGMLHQLANAGYSVLLDFVEGAESYRRAWLHDLPEAQPISLGQDGDPASKRFGWPVAEMLKCSGRLHLPEAVPPRKPRAQEALA